MDYYLDTEFLEGTQKKLFGETKPTIDLISIGIVCEDGREYYAVSKDFNLKEAWNRYDIKIKQLYGDGRNIYPEGIKTKVYWIRENVLKPIWEDLSWRYINSHMFPDIHFQFSYQSLKELIQLYGETNKQIADDIERFVLVNYSGVIPIKFFSYFGDYDWVVFCWLFGKMIDLPKGFPMYCIDLKQTLDEKAENVNPLVFNTGYKSEFKPNFDNKSKWVKNHPNYPKQVNEHNALSDAKWNKELHNFLKTL